MRLPTAIALWLIFAAVFGGLLTIHYMQPERPPVTPPGSRAEPSPD